MIKSKTNPELEKGLDKIFKRSGKFQIISGDGEIDNLRKYFQDNSMHLNTKARGQHSSLVENSINTLKRRLYIAMRTKKTTQWSEFLKNVTKSVNHDWNPVIGYLQPYLVKGLDGNGIIKRRLKSLGKWKEPNTIEEQQKALQSYKKSTSSKGFTVGSYVMLDYPEKSATEKGSLVQVNLLVLIKKLKTMIEKALKISFRLFELQLQELSLK